MPFRLETFGGLSLRSPEGAAIAAQRRQLGVLATLAAAGKTGVRRDQLISYLWPENTTESARHSLDQLLYSIRRSIADNAFAGTDPLTLNESAITSDVAEFRNLIATNRAAAALSLYTGPFLDGFHLSGAPEFERWQDGERARLSSMYVSSLARLAQEAADAGDRVHAVEFRRRIVEAEPLSARYAIAYMQSLAAAGDVTEALNYARTFETRARDELSLPADPSVRRYADELRQTARITPANQTSTNASPARSTKANIDEHASSKSNRSHRLIIVTLASLVTVAAIAFVTGPRPSDANHKLPPYPPGAAPIIAVLAFENASPDSAVEYYSYGLTDALIEKLSASGILRVIQGPSAYVVRGHRSDTRAIADSLSASTILAGGVLLENGQMNVSVRLIDGMDGTLKWTKSYRGVWEDRFSIQDSIEHQLPREIARMVGATPTRPSRQSPKTHRAYELYLRGRHVWNTPAPRPLAAMRRAIEYFNASLKEDSTYADAYAGLAAAYTVLGTGNLADFSPKMAGDSAKAAAMKAISMNDSSAEAHLALGFVYMLYDFDWDAAEAEFDRANALNPYYARAPLWPSVLYEWKGDYHRAVMEAEETVSTDPLSANAVVEYGRALFFAGSVKEAMVQVERARALDSTAERLNLTSGELFMHEGKYALAQREFERFARLTNQSSRALCFIAYLAAVSGDRAKARATLEELKRRRTARKTTAFDLAIAHAGLKEYDAAFAWLNVAYDEHSIRPIIMDPTFRDFRKDPRFDQLLKRMKLKS